MADDPTMPEPLAGATSGPAVVAVVSEHGLSRLSSGASRCVHAYSEVVDEDDVQLCRKSDYDAALERIAALEAERDEDLHVVERLSTLLAGVAIALKGDELPLHRHSYHDLPHLASGMQLELDLYRSLFPNGVPEDVLNAALANERAGGGEKL